MSEPVYVAVAAEYARRIRTGALPPGTQLPTHAEIADEHEVSNITVRKAVKLLQRQGLIRSVRRRGIFVTDHPNLARTWFLRRAHGDADLQTVLSILSMRVIWLHSRGSDQWSTFPSWPAKMTNALAHGQTWLLETDDHEPIGTITVSTKGDPDFWSPAELEMPALYAAKLATIPPNYVAEHATVPPAEIRGLGRLMLDWSVDYAARAQLQAVRIDVWRTAHDLHRWYRQNGWTKLRTVELTHRKSGALFERAATRVPLPNVCEIPALEATSAALSDD